jgi:NAD(P)-dependent dehydrogenase (short-subunit alcohol dehydrogenase family)
MRLSRLRAPAEHARVVDDDAGAARQHVAERRAGAAKAGVQRDVEDAQPLLVGHVDEIRGAAEPWEVANVIVFLASHNSTNMTGEIVSVSSQHP